MSVARARELRKNMTDAERFLWQRLRRRQLQQCKFRRQAPIGKYIVDFVSFEVKLIVELDGGQHVAREARDRVRTRWLEGQGFRVLRFWNNDVFQSTDAVLQIIWRALEDATPPSPALPDKGGREIVRPSSRR